MLAIAPATAPTLLALAIGKPVKPATTQADESVIVGGRFVAGFLVVADESSLPPNVASLHASDFIKLLQSTSLGNELRLNAADIRARVPFALIWAPRLNMSYQIYSYVAPSAVLERKDITTWHLRLRHRSADEPPWLFYEDAIAAEPLP